MEVTELENIIPVNIEDEMRGAYIDYAMSVIVSRSLPDVRDGFKPVHRRVLYGMVELGIQFNRPYKKSARIVGEVLGKYHPHGDASVYDSMVRMAQEWSLRYPLIDGQGNFGSIDGDPPAAMRYTEARLKEISKEVLSDLKKDTVDFTANFDDSLKEPSILPCKIPNLLLNGSSGIAVGMATNMAPHNLNEVVEGIIKYMDDPEISILELMKSIQAPDFPTGAIIYGYDGIKRAFETGRGKIVIRATTHFENISSNKKQIVVTQMPYQVNKALMIEKTAALVNEKKIDGIAAIRDESDRKGIRVVYELKKDAVPDVVLNTLFKHTFLQRVFSVNNITLVKGKPKILNIKQLIQYYVEHRHEVIVRRTKFDLKEAQKRLHILYGYLKALDHISEVISIIRQSEDTDSAQKMLIDTFKFSIAQTETILNMRLQRLTNLEKKKIEQEFREVGNLVIKLQEILEQKSLRMDILREELTELKKKYGDKRRTQVVFDANDLEIEDIIPDEEMVVTISHHGYIKRTPLKEYKLQNRGGVGSKGASSKEDDFTEHLSIATNHNYLLIFTLSGKVFWLKVYKLPESGKTSKGRPLQNLIQIDKADNVRAMINVKNLKDENHIKKYFLIMCSEKGLIKKTALKAYSHPRQNGIQAIKILSGDNLLNVKMTNGKNEVIVGLKSGKAIRFHESSIRSTGRITTGVKAITLKNKDDKVIGLVCIENSKSTLLVVSAKGYGKRSFVKDYRITNRGVKGVKAMHTTEKTGNLIAIQDVTDDNEIIIINKSGITIRMSMKNIRIMGRSTQGVKLIRLNKNDEISSVAKIESVVKKN